MTEIDVRCAPTGSCWTCRVTVREGASSTCHEVRVRPEDLERLAPGAAEPGELVRAAFSFLLEREPKESILVAFDLPVIGRYFPGWEAEVGRRVR